jgi:hemin uptake protein HemP
MFISARAKIQDLIVTEESSHRIRGKRDSSKAEVNPQPVVSFEEISGGASEILIAYEGQTYRLRTTRNGRLVLNK